MRSLSAAFRSFRPLTTVSVAACLLLLITAVACGPSSPEEQVTATRAQYQVVLNTWFPKVEEPAPVEEPSGGEDAEGEGEAEGEAEAEADEGEDAEGESAEGDAAEGEGEVEAAPEPTTSTVVFDLIVQFDGDEPLEGITVLATQADAAGNEKKVWREFLSMPNIVKAETKQIVVEEELELAEGDQFSVLLESYVDPANYGEYPEYSVAQ